MIMQAYQERRLKILRVDPRYIVLLLNQAKLPVRFMQIPTGDKIPDDVVVISVNADWSSNTIELLLASDQFETVEDGQVPPEIGLLKEWKVVDLREVATRLRPE
jgi:hypothetical protein